MVDNDTLHITWDAPPRQHFNGALRGYKASASTSSVITLPHLANSHLAVTQTYCMISNLTIPHCTLPPLSKPYFAIPHLTTLHLTLPHLTLSHLTKPSYYLAIPHQITKSDITILYLTVPHPTIPHLAISKLTMFVFMVFRSTSMEMRRSSIIKSRLTRHSIRSTCMEWSRTWTTKSRCLPGIKWVKASEAKQFRSVNQTLSLNFNSHQ